MGESPMVAEHGGKVYVASQSLDDRLRRTEEALERMRRLIIFIVGMTSLLVIGFLAMAYVKRDLLLALVLSLL